MTPKPSEEGFGFCDDTTYTKIIIKKRNEEGIKNIKSCVMSFMEDP